MINIKSIKPMYTKLVVTADRYENDIESNGVIMQSAGSIKEYQKVVAIGTSVRDINVGDLVMINPTRYMKKKFEDNSLREDFVENPVVSINIPVIEMDGVPYFLIEQNDVDYVIDSYEEIEDKPKSRIIQPKKDIKKPKVIL